MSKKSKIIYGSCFCEAIQFEITGKIPDLYQCHCSECRKTTGSSANAGFLLVEDQFRWVSGNENITTFTKESGYRVDFCRSCGSPVPNPTTVRPGLLWIPAGLLENLPVSMIIGSHLCVNSKANWDMIGGSAKQYAELPNNIDELL